MKAEDWCAVWDAAAARAGDVVAFASWGARRWAAEASSQAEAQIWRSARGTSWSAESRKRFPGSAGAAVLHVDESITISRRSRGAVGAPDLLAAPGWYESVASMSEPLWRRRLMSMEVSDRMSITIAAEADDLRACRIDLGSIWKRENSGTRRYSV